MKQGYKQRELPIEHDLLGELFIRTESGLNCDYFREVYLSRIEKYRREKICTVKPKKTSAKVFNAQYVSIREIA